MANSYETLLIAVTEAEFNTKGIKTSFVGSVNSQYAFFARSNIVP